MLCDVWKAVDVHPTAILERYLNFLPFDAPRMPLKGIAMGL